MATVAAQRTTTTHVKLAAWLPVVGLPVGVGVVCADWSPWIFMWTFAGSIYAGLKWLTYANCVERRKAPLWRCLGYLLLWPGMDAHSFLDSGRKVSRPSLSEWMTALAKISFGTLLVAVAVRFVSHWHQLVVGWIGWIGIGFVLHFGLFHLLSVLWRQAGVEAPPIMNVPILASSLREFWGKRWNLAFRDLSHAYVFRPLVKKFGVAGATMAVFVVSGVVHDLVISLPAGAGWGLPTAYFVIQGVGLLSERSKFGKRVGLRSGYIGRLFCFLVTLGPISLLFHKPFIERVVVPMLVAIGHT